MEELLKFCRVCLVPEEEIEFNSIFDKKGNYAEKIKLLTGLQLVSYFLISIYLFYMRNN